MRRQHETGEPVAIEAWRLSDRGKGRRAGLGALLVGRNLVARGTPLLMAITAVETGASRREAAERFEVSVASAVKWLQRWYQQRSAAPKPRGGSVSPLEEFAVEILDLIAQRPDLTLVETVAELRKRRIKTSRSSALAFSRPTQHHAQKKCCKQPNGSEQMWRERAAAGYESKVAA